MLRWVSSKCNSCIIYISFSSTSRIHNFVYYFIFPLGKSYDQSCLSVMENKRSKHKKIGIVAKSKLNSIESIVLKVFNSSVKKF